MKVVNLVKGEKWPDGSWWEARPPRDWTARRDHATHGAPYIFESPSGSRLQIGARQHSELQGFDFLFSIAPADLSAEQQNAFVSTVFAAAMQRLGPDIMETEPLHQRPKTIETADQSFAFGLCRKGSQEARARRTCWIYI